MLAGVARQNHAGMIFLCNSQKRVHLFAANLPGLIYQQHVIDGQITVGKQGATPVVHLMTFPIHSWHSTPLSNEKCW
jgi:hypothetical protein